MKVFLVLIGKTHNAILVKCISDYVSRLSHYLSFSILTLPDITKGRHLSISEQKELEGKNILKAINNTSCVVLLDEHGEEFSSIEFANWLGKRMNCGKNLYFVVGGAYGFSSSVYSRADFKISLSKMTFSHELIRLIFVEQLYRACTIQRGEPYHHE